MHLPKDEAAHNVPVEWWYFNGHLEGMDPSGHVHCYGFEYVTFQYVGLSPQPLYFGDFSVTDLDRGTFQYGVRQGSYPLPNTADSFALHTSGWTMSGGSGHDTLHADLTGYTLALTLRATEAPVLEGHGGTVNMGLFGMADYYSWPSLAARGTLTDHGVPVKVVGLSWMDHQWGDIKFMSGGGWDWFSVQLNNGRRYMLFFIRDQSGQIVESFGTEVRPGQPVQYLPGHAVSEQATGTWQSPVTGIKYGSGWELMVPGGHLTVTPDVVNQELDLKSTQMVIYWEGDVNVGGEVNGAAVKGVGYTELNPPAG